LPGDVPGLATNLQAAKACVESLVDSSRSLASRLGADDPSSTDVPLGFVTLAGCLPPARPQPYQGPSLAPQARRRMVSLVTSLARPGLVATLACVFRPRWRFLTKLREDSAGRSFPGGPICFCRESAVVLAWTPGRRPRAAGS
jgi:hypothetical protein